MLEKLAMAAGPLTERHARHAKNKMPCRSASPAPVCAPGNEVLAVPVPLTPSAPASALRNDFPAVQVPLASVGQVGLTSAESADQMQLMEALPADPRGSLLERWREASKGKGKPEVPWGSRLITAVTSWFQEQVRFVPTRREHEGFMFFELLEEPSVSADMVALLHGTTWYAGRSIAMRRMLLESNINLRGSTTLGGVTGVYLTSDWETSLWKATPHVLFDNDYHHLVVEAMVNPGRALPLKQSREPQHCYKAADVVPIGFWISRSAALENGAHRFDTWDDQLEVPWRAGAGGDEGAGHAATVRAGASERHTCPVAAAGDSSQDCPETQPRSTKATNAREIWQHSYSCGRCSATAFSCFLIGDGPVMCLRGQGWYTSRSKKSIVCPGCRSTTEEVQEVRMGTCSHTG